MLAIYFFAARTYVALHVRQSLSSLPVDVFN